MASEEMYEALTDLTRAHNSCVRKLNAHIKEVEAKANRLEAQVLDQAQELAEIKALLGLGEQVAA